MSFSYIPTIYFVHIHPLPHCPLSSHPASSCYCLLHPSQSPSPVVHAFPMYSITFFFSIPPSSLNVTSSHTPLHKHPHLSLESTYKALTSFRVMRFSAPIFLQMLGFYFSSQINPTPPCIGTTFSSPVHLPMGR